MATYLLDTNVLSEQSKADPDGEVLRRIHAKAAESVTAAPVMYELLSGCERLDPHSKERRRLVKFAAHVPTRYRVLPFDLRAARWLAKENARLVAKGKTPSFRDSLIASIAKVNDLTLVTRNVADFRPFRGLRVENWHDAKGKRAKR